MNTVSLEWKRMPPAVSEFDAVARACSEPSIEQLRRHFYDRRARFRVREQKRHYNHLLRLYYRFYIPPAKRVLEVGCGVGDLLAAVEPAEGVGIDFSAEMIATARRRHPNVKFVFSSIEVKDQDALITEIGTFEYIILSDLLNDLNDVQAMLEGLHQHATPRTRLVINYHNNVWLPILKIAEKGRLKAPSPPQNWLSSTDVRNLCRLAGWEVVTQTSRILCPIEVPFVSTLLNRWLAPLLTPLCLTIFQVARPLGQNVARSATRPTVEKFATKMSGDHWSAIRADKSIKRQDNSS